MIPLIEGPALKRYFLQHVELADAPWVGLYRVTKPLHVFKKAFPEREYRQSPAIVNLIIPVGAKVYASDDAFASWARISNRKMRASRAVVHSVVSVRSKQPASVAFSWHNNQFAYRPGAKVKPESPFSLTPERCASGIHFFLNVRDALDWL